MKYSKHILILIFTTFVTKAHSTNDIIGSRATGMGGYSATISDLWSSNNNQGGLGFITELSAGICYENRFLLKETGLKSGAFVMPLKKGAFGLSLTSFGYQAYNQNQAGLSYGLKLFEHLSAGIQINFLNTRLTPEYGQRNTFTGAIGLIANLSPVITVGAHIYNPTRSKLADYTNEKIPTIMRFGIDYTFSKKVMMGAEIEKDIDFLPVVKVGIEYHAVEKLYLRGGISTNPTLSSFGFGILFKDFKLDISSSFHQTLGLTPSISLIYTKSK